MTIKKKECGDCSLCCKLPEINYFKKKKNLLNGVMIVMLV